jgi:hypothetical protein
MRGGQRRMVVRVDTGRFVRVFGIGDIGGVVFRIFGALWRSWCTLLSLGGVSWFRLVDVVEW